MSTLRGPGTASDPLVGRLVEGRYRICRAIGKGGMGLVYEAEHSLTGRKVAVKVLAAHASASAAAEQRFLREARAAASVGNAHVVDVLDMGQLDGGSLYLVLEHLDGDDLSHAVAREPFSVARAIHVLCQLCDGLSAVHDAGIIHRDLKPENIFLIARDGEPEFVKVLDFGVCKWRDAEDTRVTVSGDRVGTPLFMAPEQVEGRPDVDQRADIYALGAILYFLLTRHAPFESNAPQLFFRICNEPAPSVCTLNAAVPSELDHVIQRTLSKNREERFASCADLKAALLPFAGASAVALTTHAGAFATGSTGSAGVRRTLSLVRSLGLAPRKARISRALQGALVAVSLMAATIYFVLNSRATISPRDTPAPLPATRVDDVSRAPILPAPWPATTPAPLPTASLTPIEPHPQPAPAPPRKPSRPPGANNQAARHERAELQQPPAPPLPAAPSAASDLSAPTSPPPAEPINRIHLNQEPKLGL